MLYNSQTKRKKERKMVGNNVLCWDSARPTKLRRALFYDLVGIILLLCLHGQSFGASPSIVSPSKSTYTVMTSHLLRIPFEVNEPDNDVVDYSVTSSNGSTLPSGASFSQLSATGEWEFTWFPKSSNIGKHNLRFTAIDKKGAKAVKDISVDVKPATGAPTLYVSDEIGASTTFIHFDDPIYIKGREKKALELRVDLAGVDGHPLSLEIDVVDDRGEQTRFWYQEDTRTVGKLAPNTLVIRRSMKSSSEGGRGDRGVYSGVMKVRDETTNQVTSIPVVFDIALASHNSGNSRQTPFAVINIHDARASKPNWEEVDGIVALDLDFRTKYGRGKSVSGLEQLSDLVDGTQIQYILYTPPGGGGAADSNEILEISPVLKDDYTFEWDSRSVPDGTYVMGVKFIGGPHINNLMVQDSPGHY